MTTPRYLPSKPFPAYAFVPGVNEHPHLPHPEANADHLKYAFDLFNHDFFWEAHVYFESFWIHHGRSGSTADFFKAMILLCAAGVKMLQGKKELASVPFEKAKLLFDLLAHQEGAHFLGCDLVQIGKDIKKTQHRPPKIFLLELKSKN